MNLAGIDHGDVKRGMTLAAPGQFRTTRRVDVRLTLLPSARKLKHRARVHFHAGTAETIAEILLYGESALAPGQSALAHLRLQDEVLLSRATGSSCGNFRRWLRSAEARCWIAWQGGRLLRERAGLRSRKHGTRKT